MPSSAQVSRPADGEMAGQGDAPPISEFLRFAAPTRHPEEPMISSTLARPVDRRTGTLQRAVPLAGVLFAGLQAAGVLTIGPFPDGSTPAGNLAGFYAAHGDHVALGGTLLGLSALCFAVFAAGLWARVRGAAPTAVGGVVLLGAAVETMAELQGGSVYQLLGRIGVDPQVTAPALQAWHISGSEFGVTGGIVLLLVGIAAAGIGWRAVPRWLTWTGLVLAAALFTPWSFIATLVFLLWTAAAGVALAVRPEPAPMIS
jgi:hypothetical protein